MQLLRRRIRNAQHTIRVKLPIIPLSLPSRRAPTPAQSIVWRPRTLDRCFWESDRSVWLLPLPLRLDPILRSNHRVRLLPCPRRTERERRAYRLRVWVTSLADLLRWVCG